MAKTWSELLVNYNKRAAEHDDIREISNVSMDRAKALEIATKECFANMRASQLSSKLKIPQFFGFGQNNNNNKNNEIDMSDCEDMEEAANILNDIAREMLLDEKEENLASERDLDLIYNNMRTLLSECNNETGYMNYEIFRELKALLPQRTHIFFKPNIYRLFIGNEFGMINGFDFFQFISLGVNTLHQYISLCRYDSMGKNSLTESDLEMFINDNIDMTPSLSNVDKQFHQYYVYHCVRKFMFVLDPLKKNKINISKLITSNVYQEYNRFRFNDTTTNQHSKNNTNINNNGNTNNSNDNNNNKSTNETTKNEQESILITMLNNWFSVQTSMRVYRLYVELDKDRTGTLSFSELLQYNSSSLSNLCVTRIFQYKRTFDGEMDYKGFLDFVLANENKHLKSSLQYWWEIIDLDNKGYITPLDIHTLFRSVQKKMGIFGLEPVPTEDVMTEIIDMVHPKSVEKITKQELLDSKMFGTIVDILTDVKGFYEYENREVIMQQPQDAEN